MEKRINLLQWIRNFNSGKYNNPDVKCQIKAGWYDWFCNDSRLVKGTINMGKKLQQIVLSNKINPETSYVFFKNNCPCVGKTYDDFRICDIKTGDVIFTISPKSGMKIENGKGHVWGKENDFEEALFTGTWKEIKNWFNKG
jgi:hypothetical protein